MYNISNLSQVLNTLNSMLLEVRMELNTLKNDVTTFKTNQQSAQLTTVVEGLQNKVTSCENDAAKLKTNHAYLDQKIETLEKTLTNKIDGLIPNASNVSKEEVKSMIDSSIAALLGGLQSSTDQHEVDIQSCIKDVVDVEKAATDEIQVEIPLLSLQDPVEEAPKTKRGGRKKKQEQ